VLSEPLKAKPDPNVIAWFNRQIPERLFLPSMVIGEILFGVATMPPGRSKDLLSDAYGDLLSHFEGRVLPFDEDAARQWAQINASANLLGRPISIKDGIIAATAAAHGYAIATRNTSDFDATGLQIINPWINP
jgi:predicted nucleic acid-binding protein